MRLTLGDVLDHPEFGLELCGGGDAAHARPVDGAHSIDLPDPVPWLQEGWIMLTTGQQLRGSASAQRRLVAELADGRIAAIALGLGIALHRVPRALLQEAERRDFPVIVVPLETPFREIESFVNRSYLSADLYVMRRQSSMQRYLLDAMRHGVPEQSLVERLGSLLGGADVAYVDADARPIATTTPDIDWAGAALDLTRSNVREFEHQGRWGVVAPVMDGDTPTGSLVALLAPATVSRQVARPVVRTASEFLGVVSAARLAGTRERRTRRRRLGERALRVVRGAQDDGLPAALAAEGIDFTGPCHVALLSCPAGARRSTELHDALEHALEAGGADAVLAPDGDHFMLVAHDDLAELATWLRGDRRLTAMRGGVSEAFGQLGDLVPAMCQAQLALAVALTSPNGSALQRHDALEPSVALLGGPTGEAVRARLIGVLATLEGEPRLRTAVVAYMEAGLDLGQAARALDLHRNSVRYRLDRAEKLLGRSLRAPATIATIHLALLAERLEPVDVGRRCAGS